MTDREKLNELLDSFSTPVMLGDVKLMDWTIPTEHIRDDLVAHLIANGVRLNTKQATSDKTSEESKRWIPVSERLPEIYKPVLVCVWAKYSQRYLFVVSELLDDEAQ